VADWKSIIDEALKDAQNAGQFDKLPGAGRPLKLDDTNPYESDDMRMANKMLKDNDLVPDWIAEGRALEHDHDKLMARIQKQAQHGRVPASLEEAVSKYNKRALSYNLKVPQGVAHRRIISLEREIAKLGR
jgi:hypothetical protein